jgi:hypothetical protein
VAVSDRCSHLPATPHVAHDRAEADTVGCLAFRFAGRERERERELCVDVSASATAALRFSVELLGAVQCSAGSRRPDDSCSGLDAQCNSR